MNLLFLFLIVLAVLSIATVVWDVRSDGYRAHPVDPALRQRLLDAAEVRAAAAAEAAATAEAATAELPVQDPAAVRSDQRHVATRRPRIRAQRAIH